MWLSPILFFLLNKLLYFFNCQYRCQWCPSPRGPQFVCSFCHRQLFRKSVTSVIEKLREKIKHSIEEKVRKAHVKSKTGAAEFNGRSKSNSLQEGSANAEVRKSKLKRKTKLVLPGKGKAEAASPSGEVNEIPTSDISFQRKKLGV